MSVFPPGTAKPISFTVYKVDAGEYQVDIGGASGTFYVVAEPQAPGGAAQPAAMGLDTGTMVIIIVIGFVLIAGIIVAIVVSSRP